VGRGTASGGGDVRWAGPALAAAVLLSLYVLFWPSPAGAAVTLPGADKLVHLGLFLLLAGTAALRFGAVSAVLASVLGYAVASEVVQAVLLAERSGDAWDVLADVVGAVVGWHLVRRQQVTRRR
jgi:VanZ family protein